MWQLYGKGKNHAQLMAAHALSSTPEMQKCAGPCGKILPLDHFSVSKDRTRSKCRICRSEDEVAKNDSTRPSADRIGLTWSRDEIKFVEECKDLSDQNIAVALRRTISAVRAQRCKLGQGHKRAKVVKPLFNEFAIHREDGIKNPTVDMRENKIIVWCNTHTLWANIWKAFIDAGLADEDYKAWVIGVTAGC